MKQRDVDKVVAYLEIEKLAKRVPAGKMREALLLQTDIKFVKEMVEKYEDADDWERREIRGFFASDGPKMVAKAKRKFARKKARRTKQAKTDKKR
jgi:hypothetical protein